MVGTEKPLFPWLVTEIPLPGFSNADYSRSSEAEAFFILTVHAGTHTLQHAFSFVIPQ